MESRGVLHFCLIQCIYSFVSVRFLPAVPTFAVFDLLTVLEAKSADHPGWVGRKMYRPGRRRRCSHHLGHRRRQRRHRRHRRRQHRHRRCRRRRLSWDGGRRNVLMKRSVTARRRRISTIKLIDDLPFGDDSEPATGSTGFCHSLRTFPRGVWRNGSRASCRGGTHGLRRGGGINLEIF
jgi:hypothetical protein